MKTATLSLLLTLVLALFFFSSPHYKKGPTLTDNGFTATATGTLAGLGNGNVLATLSFPNAVGTTLCTNAGGNTAPGQNPALPVSVSGSASLGNPKNGTLSFTVTTDPPADPTSAQAGCANNNWTASFDNITFGNGTLTISQDVDGNGTYETVVLVTPVSL